MHDRYEDRGLIGKRRHGRGAGRGPGHLAESHVERGLPQVVDSFPVDERPSGIRGRGGNVRDGCVHAFTDAGPRLVDGRVVPPPDVPAAELRVMRGGAWDNSGTRARSATRDRSTHGNRPANHGFRLVRSLQG